MLTNATLLAANGCRDCQCAARNAGELAACIALEQRQTEIDGFAVVDHGYNLIHTGTYVLDDVLHLAQV